MSYREEVINVQKLSDFSVASYLVFVSVSSFTCPLRLHDIYSIQLFIYLIQ